jgi:TetR/AcrR family transcriptional regulator, cholesterol catabolism regulator
MSRKSVNFDRKLEEILREAAAVFRSLGYHQASMRDIARATGVSLAGLYYYSPSKKHLLYSIQKHAFEELLASARTALELIVDPVERLRTFVGLHLQFFLEHPNEMKVLTHEEDSLEADLRREVKAIKKAYYQLCYHQVEALKQARNLVGLNTRLAVLSLFGMMNWIYTWYNPKVDPDSAAMTQQMTDIFLSGITGTWGPGAVERATARPAVRGLRLGNGAQRSRQGNGGGAPASPKEAVKRIRGHGLARIKTNNSSVLIRVDPWLD